jgi:glycosyltransferase involved in cell wall biosynthesis
VTPIRVALDGRPLQSRPLGGVGRYLTGLIPELADHIEVFVLLDGRQAIPDSLDARVQLVTIAAPRGAPGLGWLEVAVTPWLRRFGGLFHGTFNMLPLSFRGRGVITLHDLAPQLHSEDFRPFTRAAWRLYIRASVARARVITTVSEFTKGQIARYFAVDPARIQVAPDAVDPVFDPGRAQAAPALARALGIADPYVVAIGGAPRRGLPVAVEAWRRAREQVGGELSLAVLGRDSLRPEPGLHVLPVLDDDAWATLLAGAHALCYPTRYEGFGLPALEALASGTPVVCSPVASLPEVLGDGACWVPGPQPEAMAAVLVRLLRQPDWRASRREAGLARARAVPSWRDSAAALLDAYERAVA